jgi:DNA-binding transcriptional LysR family regulator
MHMVHPPLAALDLNLMVVLQAVLAERNVTRAARRVGLSQSAASHALARLRQLLGDPLLVRSGRRLDLTPRALALLPPLERGLAELASAVSGEPPFDARSARRSFTVAMADYGQAVLLAPVLRRLRRQAPGFDLSVVAFPNTLELMDAGTVDLALLARLPLPSGFASRSLFNDGFVCMVRRGHRAVTGARLSLRQYLALDHLVVSPAGSPGSMVDDELDRRGLTRRIAVRVSSFLAAPVVVTQSDLIGTGPERLLRPLAARFPIRLLRPPLRLPRFELDLVWHTRRDHDPAHRLLRDIVAAAATDDDDAPG